MSFRAAFFIISSIFDNATSLSISNPKAVGFKEIFALIWLDTINSKTLEYSSTKYLASPISLISSPKTSIVKQASSFDIFFIKSIADSRFEPAT